MRDPDSWWWRCLHAAANAQAGSESEGECLRADLLAR